MSKGTDRGQGRGRLGTLQQLTVETVALNIEAYTTLGVLPLDCVAALVNRVLLLNSLTPHSLKLFLETNYDEIKEFFSNAREPPPVIHSFCNPKSM
jgi:hypothetical protein